MAFLRRTHHTQVGNNLPVTVFHDLTHTRHPMQPFIVRSEEHTSELQSLRHLVCRLLLEKTTDSRISVHNEFRTFASCREVLLYWAAARNNTTSAGLRTWGRMSSE